MNATIIGIVITRDAARKTGQFVGPSRSRLWIIRGAVRSFSAFRYRSGSIKLPQNVIAANMVIAAVVGFTNGIATRRHNLKVPQPSMIAASNTSLGIRLNATA